MHAVVYTEREISHLDLMSFSLVWFVCVRVFLGGSVLVQRVASESVEATPRRDMCYWSLVAAASPVCCGEPAGLCHSGGAELGLHTGSH